MRRLFFGLGVVLIGASSAQEVGPADVFNQLKSLVGAWEGKTETGRLLRVDYKLSAGETVLVETWTLGAGRESMTLYHMDNQDLVATHYCPIGNQPRLRPKTAG